jgi:hypothetical protein
MSFSTTLPPTITPPQKEETTQQDLFDLDIRVTTLPEGTLNGSLPLADASVQDSCANTCHVSGCDYYAQSCESCNTFLWWCC